SAAAMGTIAQLDEILSGIRPCPASVRGIGSSARAPADPDGGDVDKAGVEALQAAAGSSSPSLGSSICQGFRRASVNPVSPLPPPNTNCPQTPAPAHHAPAVPLPRPAVPRRRAGCAATAPGTIASHDPGQAAPS